MYDDERHCFFSNGLIFCYRRIFCHLRWICLTLFHRVCTKIESLSKWIGAYYTPFTANGYRWVHWQFRYMIAEMDGIFCAWAIRFRRESYRSRYASSQKTPSLLHVRILRVFPIRIAQTWRDFVYLRQNGSKLPHIFEVGTSNRRGISFFFSYSSHSFFPTFESWNNCFRENGCFFWKKFPE